MSVYKEPTTNTWRAVYRYTNWKGEKKQSQKRGFQTKREAQAWEREQLRKLTADMDMTLEQFVAIYEADMKSRLRETTWQVRRNVLHHKILPYLGKKRMCDITSKDVIAWQNEMMNYRKPGGKGKGQGYSPLTLRSLSSCMTAVFNHAVKYYGLKASPASIVGVMGKGKGKEMLFWTKAEYLKFSETLKDDPLFYHAFEMLYWCGLRLGELLALTPADFDWGRGTVTVSKSYQRLRQRDVITGPKTAKGNRVIQLPQFLRDEMRAFLGAFYSLDPADRIFTMTKYSISHRLEKGAAEAGVKRIRVHDLRHSHVSLLIDMGFSAIAIADRVGHESIDITYRYAHLFPTRQTEMADRLDKERMA